MTVRREQQVGEEDFPRELFFSMIHIIYFALEFKTVLKLGIYNNHPSHLKMFFQPCRAGLGLGIICGVRISIPILWKTVVCVEE